MSERQTSRTAAKQGTTAATESDKQKANQDGKDNSTSNDPNLSTLTPEGKLATNREQVPTNFSAHCGYCGQPVGPEGQHWDADNGEQVENPHAGVLVVADNWPEKQDEQDEGKHKAEKEKAEETGGLTEK